MKKTLIALFCASAFLSNAQDVQQNDASLMNSTELSSLQVEANLIKTEYSVTKSNGNDLLNVKFSNKTNEAIEFNWVISNEHGVIMRSNRSVYLNKKASVTLDAIREMKGTYELNNLSIQFLIK